MRKQLYINGNKITAKEFAWDECHKIYLINTEEDRKTFFKLDYDFFPIKELKDAYEDSCSLKFISNADLQGENIVSQFEEAVFEERNTIGWGD